MIGETQSQMGDGTARYFWSISQYIYYLVLSGMQILSSKPEELKWNSDFTYFWKFSLC